MTFAEQREGLIETACKGFHNHMAKLGFPLWDDPEIEEIYRDMRRETMAAAFEAVFAAGFSIIGPEVTADMVRANGELPHNTPLWERFKEVIAAGNLARKPE